MYNLREKNQKYGSKTLNSLVQITEDLLQL